jgi:phage recombination protein Bet
MSNTELATRQTGAVAHPSNRAEIIRVLGSSLYPGAASESIELVLAYCEAKGLNPMQKPVHIVPMWDPKAKRMRDVIMEGINSYRIAAARSHEFAGMSEPIYGPMVERTFHPSEGKGAPFKLSYPEWCRVTAMRIVAGEPRSFTAVEYWEENYATAGKDTDAPNAMWRKRPRGQLSKCTQAQALRIAFPELAGAMTAEELEGKSLEAGEIIDVHEVVEPPAELLAAARAAAQKGREAFGSWWKDKSNGGQTSKADREALVHYVEEFRMTARVADDAMPNEPTGAAVTADEGPTFGDDTLGGQQAGS